MKKIKVAVIGTGHLGKIHARIYNNMPQVELAGICDIDKEKANSCALEFKSIAYLDYKKLINKVDAVSIATPTITHFKIARAFLKNNIHVLVEKPITSTTLEAQKLIKFARAKRKILQVGHVERFNPAIRTIQGFCKNPKFIECHRLSPYPKRGTDVSVILDLMIHDIDIVLSLVKSPLLQTHAIGVNVLSPNEDIASVRLIFKNGTVCNLTASRVSDEGMRKIRIFQKDSYLSLDYAQQKIICYKKENNRIIKEEILVAKKEPLAEELSSFIECIKKGKQPIVRGKEAKDALEIALAITKQIRKNA
ncbi:MAG: Gfo/Idh/MocA family oxidoreductase [Candidatus Omnitrophica bacterium]|nr:Gfo/Idh/MocA family oxidoreductase [Candidatus Omnitrophota bacterium]